MEHNKYWAERFEQLTEAELRKADELSAEMVKEYRQIAQDLNDDIQRWYARFAAENKMSLAEARRVLNAQELAEFRWTVDEYIKNAKKDGLTGEYTQRLKNASARVHIDRLEAIRYQMAQHVERLAARENARLTDVLRDIYPDAYLRTGYEVQKKTDFDSFARIPEADVERILKKPWVSDGLNFSDRIWRDKERLLSTLQGELTRGLIRGDPYAKIAQRIAGRMNVAMSAASRLVETEAAFFSSKGQLDAFRDLGVEQYEFVATLDGKTSEICREMDGKVLPLSEFKPGITAPPLHCHCRSTTCPYFDDEFTENETRAARDPETGKTVQVDSKLSYGDWKDIFVDKKLTLDEWKAKNVASQATNAAGALNAGAQSGTINAKEAIKQQIAATQLDTCSVQDVVRLGKAVCTEHDVLGAIGNPGELRAIFANYREMGGALRTDQWAKGSSTINKQMLSEAFAHYPKAWVDYFTATGRKLYTRKEQRGYFSKNGAVKNMGRYYVRTLPNYATDYFTIAIDGQRKTTPWHEIGHMIEHLNSDALRISKMFVAARTAGETPIPLQSLYPGRKYGANETTKKDNFVSPYIGKEYTNASEVLSMGLEGVFCDTEFEKRVTQNNGKNDVEYAKIGDDEEFLNLIIGLILLA